MMKQSYVYGTSGVVPVVVMFSYYNFLSLWLYIKTLLEKSIIIHFTLRYVKLWDFLWKHESLQNVSTHSMHVYSFFTGQWLNFFTSVTWHLHWVPRSTSVCDCVKLFALLFIGGPPSVSGNLIVNAQARIHRNHKIFWAPAQLSCFVSIAQHLINGPHYGANVRDPPLAFKNSAINPQRKTSASYAENNVSFLRTDIIVQASRFWYRYTCLVYIYMFTYG